MSPIAVARLHVVATTQDLAALATAVGGEHVKAVALTKGTSDPHFAVAKPSMIRRLLKADLLLVVGADLEVGWLPAALQAGRNRRVQPGQSGHLDLSTVVPLLGKAGAPVSRALGDVHSKGNPHYWLDPANGGSMARAIAARLEQLDPDNSDAYRRQLARFEGTLNAKIASWKERLAPLTGQPIIAYHNSFIYLANAFEFRIVDEVEPLPGIAPTAAHLNQLVSRIKAEKIGLLIMEPFYERRSARYLNDKTGIRAAVIPQSVGAEGQINTYYDLFDSIVEALLNPSGV